MQDHSIALDNQITSLVNSEKFSICVIGLGYVGLPLSIALSKEFDVMGYDVDEERIADLNLGLDRHQTFTKEQLLQSGMTFTNQENDIQSADV